MFRSTSRAIYILLFLMYNFSLANAQESLATLSSVKPVTKDTVSVDHKNLMIRIAEIEIFPEHLEDYKSILMKEASQSVKVEPGVIAIFPLFVKENPTTFRLLEVYASEVAYQSHLQTAHFKLYKASTSKMVKSLKLIEMGTVDPETMKLLFKKLK